MSMTPQSTIVSSKILADGGIVLGLLVALAIVFMIDRGSSTGPKSEPGKDPSVSIVTKTEPVILKPSAPPLRIGVTTAELDDMGSLLTSLGEGFKYQEVKLEELVNPARLNEFDVLFVTCGSVPDSWVEKDVGESDRPGFRTVTVRRDVLLKVKENLRRFVERGATLYASDLRFSMIANSFPETIDERRHNPGKAQEVDATVVDAGLIKLLGPRIPLRFDKDGWIPAAFEEKDVAVLLRGNYVGQDGQKSESPLMAKFQVKDGTVIFTSFHNEKLSSKIAQQLLRYLVFATVLARTESKTRNTLVNGGFSPKASNLLSASAEAPSVTQTYQSAAKDPMRFALAFNDAGATLRLTVLSPDGRKFEREGTSAFDIDVPQGAVGDWTYTITAVRVPYPNFPFNLVIGVR